MSKDSILILFYSGSGSTKMISGIIKERLSESFKVDMVEVTDDFDYSIIPEYSLLIFAYPTFYTHPPRSLIGFINKMPLFNNSCYSYVITTYGLFTGNSIRSLSKSLLEKNIITVSYKQIKGPGSDVVLLFPEFTKYFRRYEKKAAKKLETIIFEAVQAVESGMKKPKIPRYKIYGFFNSINDYLGERYYNNVLKKNIHILPERCNNCQLCIESCVRKSWMPGNPVPEFDPGKCEFCLKCVHNCPTNAIVFSEKMKDRIRLNRGFYNDLKINF